MFTTFLSSENKANDQKKLKKMVEELANKYGKTEDEIFYAYDQWVFFLLKQKSLLFGFFCLWKRTLIQTCKSISSGSWRNIPQEWSRRSSSLTRWGLSIRMQKNVDNVETWWQLYIMTGRHLVWLCVRDVRRGQQWEHGLSREHDCNHNNYTVTMLMIWGKRALEKVKCVQAKFAMMMSTPEEKLSWIFEIFDSDGGGKKNHWKVTK